MEQQRIGGKKNLDIFSHILVTYSLFFTSSLPLAFLSLSHSRAHTHRHLKMGTSTHMGIWKVVLDICSPSKHLKGISTGEKKRRGRKGREGREVYLNGIIEESFPPQSCFSTTLLQCVLYNLYEWYNFGFNGTLLPVL